MKKILIIIGLMVSLPVYATSMCAENDTIAVVLDPTINGTTSTYDNTAGWWRTTFSYGQINGISACLSSKNGKSIGGTVENLTDNGQEVVGSERNGQYCWCKMTHPVASLWVFDYDRGSRASCASDCAANCGISAQNYSALRVGLFGSVGN